MAKSKLETRLTRQIAARGQAGAGNIAKGLLLKRGHIKADGSLTAEGKKRQDLGNDGRAKDREAKYSGGKRKPSDFKYDPKTNAATLKKK
jgi:hypothetical protein